MVEVKKKEKERKRENASEMEETRALKEQIVGKLRRISPLPLLPPFRGIAIVHSEQREDEEGEKERGLHLAVGVQEHFNKFY